MYERQYNSTILTLTNFHNLIIKKILPVGIVDLRYYFINIIMKKIIFTEATIIDIFNKIL